MKNITELRTFINENSEALDQLAEMTVSANLAVPTNIQPARGHREEDVPDDVNSINVDDEVEDTDEKDRSGSLGVQLGAGAEKHTKDSFIRYGRTTQDAGRKSFATAAYGA